MTQYAVLSTNGLSRKDEINMPLYARLSDAIRNQIISLIALHEAGNHASPHDAMATVIYRCKIAKEEVERTRKELESVIKELHIENSL